MLSACKISSLKKTIEDSISSELPHLHYYLLAKQAHHIEKAPHSSTHRELMWIVMRKT